MLIDKPGFYTSKAGKCEVVAVKDEYAIGWANDGPAYWHCDSGVQFGGTWWRNDITGPFVEPRKPEEVWVVKSAGWESDRRAVFVDKADAEEFLNKTHHRFAPRLIHLREVEE